MFLLLTPLILEIMKVFKSFLLLVIAAVAIFFFDSCKKDDITPFKSENPVEIKANRIPSASCEIVTVELTADKNIKIGSVVVSNNSKSLFVKYNAEGNWYLDELHLYVGDFRRLPRTSSGNPIPGHFPYQMSFTELTQVYTMDVPLSSIDYCFKIAAHASVSQRNENGEVIKTATAWGNGTLINLHGNWGMYFDACIPTGNTICDNIH